MALTPLIPHFSPHVPILYHFYSTCNHLSPFLSTRVPISYRGAATPSLKRPRSSIGIPIFIYALRNVPNMILPYPQAIGITLRIRVYCEHMKKYFLCIALLCLSLPATSHAAQETRLGTIVENARMRTGATLHDSIITVNKAGTTVTILGTAPGWVEIQNPAGQRGWTADWLIREITTPDQKIDVQHTGTVNANARMRSAGSLSGALIRVLLRGTTVTIVEHQNGWYRIQDPTGVEGWTADWLIDRAEHTPVAEPIASATSTAPASIDEGVLNQYWLQKINTLRAARNLRPLVLDSRWQETATEYAAYMATSGARAHERADGKTMHQWIDTKSLPFTTRYSVGGWRTNYFSENITWGEVNGTTEDVQRKIDRTLDFFLSEEPTNGAHYRTIYHEDWNSVGLGFHFRPLERGRYDMQVVMHYGSLVLD